MSQKRILSGIQPTSNLHLGNYLGAVRNWRKMQDEPDFQCLYMIADLHATTAKYDPKNLAAATREIGAALLAAGIRNPQKSGIFVQSNIREHTELNWYLTTMAQMGKLDRMTQFKDKAGENAESANLGLYAYPVLMTADILLYKATHVPVGDDQKQHLELAREIGRTFNSRAKSKFFPEPHTLIMGAAPRVMSLADGTKKMSKSDEDHTRINLIDDADAIAKKFKRAKSGMGMLPETVESMNEQPEAQNLLTIYAALSEREISDVLAEFAGKQFSAIKNALTEITVEKVAPMTARMKELMADPAEIDRVLKAGNDKARPTAQKNMEEIRDIMGFWK